MITLPTDLEWTAVESSQIKRVAHKDDVLFVNFHNGDSIYAYPQVKVETFNAMISAESVGKFLNAEVKPNHSFERLQ